MKYKSTGGEIVRNKTNIVCRSIMFTKCSIPLLAVTPHHDHSTGIETFHRVQTKNTVVADDDDGRKIEYLKTFVVPAPIVFKSIVFL